MEFSEFDSRMMAYALELATQGIFTSFPNPRVGCVITLNEQIIGSGFHFAAGEGHAEVNALNSLCVAQFEHRLKEVTAYITLEPCSHQGKTGPCAQALIDAGVGRVICAMKDPNPQVSGRGIAMLEAAGVEVAVGLLEDQAYALNPGYIKCMTEQMPYVRLKTASSLDGRTGLKSGESQWITSEPARRDVQAYRLMSDVVITGSGTVHQDKPRLNVRKAQLPATFEWQGYQLKRNETDEMVQLAEQGIAPGIVHHQTDEYRQSIWLPDEISQCIGKAASKRYPTRLVLGEHYDGEDLQGLFWTEGDIILYGCSEQALAQWPEALKQCLHIGKTLAGFQLSLLDPKKVLEASGCAPQVWTEPYPPLQPLIYYLGRLGFQEIWVEAGAQLAASFWQQDLVDEWVFYLGGVLLGKTAKPLLNLESPLRMDDAKRLKLLDIARIGQDVRLVYQPERENKSNVF